MSQASTADAPTPAVHRPIMVDEVLAVLRPRAGEVAVDCTLGGGGHARAMLGRLGPGGRLIGIDVDPVELGRTEARLRGEGFGPEVCTVRAASFADLPRVLRQAGVAAADLVLADLGVSAMQHDDPARGFHYKQVGPLDMRMDASRGETAAQLLARASEDELVAMLTGNADEPHARLIARLLKRQPVDTTHGLERLVRAGLTSLAEPPTRRAVKMSVRRTFQALRIAVNDELAALDALLSALPVCLAPGGRAAILTFHSGEDRRVKKAFKAGLRDGAYRAIATQVIRSAKDETRANRRAASAKLRWAERGRAVPGGRDTLLERP